MSIILEETRALPRIVLLACGCFSPPTPMHMRMFEIARDYFKMNGKYQVVGGIISPTHDSYGKKDLATAKHRYAMIELGLKTSTWIRVSDWEITQSKWSRTKKVLDYHQNFINNYINSPAIEGINEELPSWLPKGLRERNDSIQVRLLCGADLLESFAIPGLWSDTDIIDIVINHGLIVISRCGTNAEKFIFESDVLTKYQRYISLITNWVSNDISSTVIRKLLRRGQSVKYLLDDSVLDYIKTNGLFNCKPKYITDATRPIMQNVCNVAYLNQINCIKTSTSSNYELQMNNADNNISINVNEENMDEMDHSIKNTMVDTNLNKEKSKVFCCAKSDNITTKLFNDRMRPGQAVQVITTESGIISATEISDHEKILAKRMKVSTAHNV